MPPFDLQVIKTVFIFWQIAFSEVNKQNVNTVLIERRRSRDRSGSPPEAVEADTFRPHTAPTVILQLHILTYSRDYSRLSMKRLRLPISMHDSSSKSSM